MSEFKLNLRLTVIFSTHCMRRIINDYKIEAKNHFDEAAFKDIACRGQWDAKGLRPENAGPGLGRSGHQAVNKMDLTAKSFSKRIFYHLQFR